jgi:HD-GYP domain-containing protein (c-di-GMP phosphodiesterase class II)
VPSRRTRKRPEVTTAPYGAVEVEVSASDQLGALNSSAPLSTKLVEVHRVIQQQYPFVARVAIAISDPRTNSLKTYLHSSDGDDPLPNYQASLAEAPSLAAVFEARRPRVVNDLSIFEAGRREHTRRILDRGYRASFTLPMMANDVFFGFVFFNSLQSEVFTERVTAALTTYGHLIALLIVSELSALRALVSTLAGALHLAKTRDPESASHLDRISRYSRLVASRLGPRRYLSGEFIERVFEFSPLHDIGKIGIPDEIVLKPGELSSEEWALMREHPRRGLAIVDGLLGSAGLEAMAGLEILRNIVLHHHERVDGTGYPSGLAGERIPLEARIVAVADVFDALTSERPYKRAWSVAEASQTMRELSGRHLDGECVEALVLDLEPVEEIRSRFAEDRLG